MFRGLLVYNKCSYSTIEVQLSTLYGNYDRPTDRRAEREVLKRDVAKKNYEGNNLFSGHSA